VLERAMSEPRIKIYEELCLEFKSIADAGYRYFVETSHPPHHRPRVGDIPRISRAASRVRVQIFIADGYTIRYRLA
jgi:hypothetical protein